MKIVFDTNVILSAYLTRGLACTMFEHCLEEHEIIISTQILAELESRLQQKLKIPREKASAMLNLLRIACQVSAISEVDPSSCRDQSDLHILGLAENSKADIIISGDDDLLCIRAFQGIPIWSPRQFWEMERKNDPRLLGRMEKGTSKKIHEKSPGKYGTPQKKRGEKTKE